jgi:anti-anti-sigma factor
MVHTTIATDLAIIEIEHDLDRMSIHSFQDQFDRLDPASLAGVVLFFNDVKSLQSTTIGAIIWAFKRCRKEGFGFSLAVTNERAREALALTKADQLFSVGASLDEAKEAARQPPTQSDDDLP